MLSAQSLKGIELGSTWAGEVLEEDPTIGYMSTTLGGVTGQLATYSLRNGKIYMVAFIPEERIYNSEVTRILEGVKKKLNISKLKLHEDYKGKLYSYFTGKWTLIISCDENKYLEPPTELRLYLSDDSLAAIAEKETQANANKDF